MIFLLVGSCFLVSEPFSIFSVFYYIHLLESWRSRVLGFLLINIYILGIDVDYWSGLIYKSMGFPLDFFPVSISPPFKHPPKQQKEYGN